MTDTIVYGATEARDYQLYDAGAELVGTGLTVGLELLLSGGTEWAASTAYAEGDFIRPTTPNGQLYKCTTAGTSGSTEPAFSTTSGQTQADGTAVWTDVTPTVAWLAQATGTVRVSWPYVLPVGSYRVRFTLTDSGGKLGYAPNSDDPDKWLIVATRV